MSGLFVIFGTSNTMLNLYVYFLLFTHLPLVKHITNLKKPFGFGGKRMFSLELIIFSLHWLFSSLDLPFFSVISGVLR